MNMLGGLGRVGTLLLTSTSIYVDVCACVCLFGVILVTILKYDSCGVSVRIHAIPSFPSPLNPYFGPVPIIPYLY